MSALSEIARLLLLLHETYVRNVSGWRETLSALMLFLHDAKLSHLVSVLEAEGLRRKVMSKALSMGYDMFYEWLREVGTLIFPFEGENGRRRALHALLTQYIIPMATEDGECKEWTNPAFRLVDSDAVSMPQKWMSFDVMLEFADFFHVWFAALVTETPSATSRLTPTRQVWVTANGSGGLSIARFVATLESMGIVPTVLTQARANSMLRSSLTSSGSLRSDRGTPSMSFSLFLLAFEIIAAQLTVNNLQALSYEDDIESVSMQLLQLVAVSLLGRTLSNFTSDFSRNTQGFASSDLLWLFRQGGFTQLRNVSLLWLASQVAHIGSSGPDELSRTILDVFIRLSPVDNKRRLHLDALGVSTDDQCALYCAKTCPTMLFATPTCACLHLRDLYLVQNIARLGEVLQPCCIDKLEIKKTAPARSTFELLDQVLLEGLFQTNEVYDTTLSTFLRYCDSSGLTSALGEPSLLIRTIYLVIDRCHPQNAAVSHDIFSSAFDLVRLTRNDVLEIMFIFSTFLDTNVSTTCEEWDSVQCFSAFMHALVLGRSSVVASQVRRRFSPMRKTEVVEYNHATESLALAVEQATFSSCCYDLSSVSSNCFPPHLYDVLVLLLHFPISRRDLNPWSVVDLFNSRFSVEPSSSDVTQSKEQAENYRVFLPFLFREFVVKYALKGEDLSSYFGSFITRDFKGNDAFKMKPNVREALSSRVMSELLNPSSLAFLQKNEHLLVFEFVRVAATFRSNDPFTLGLAVPWGCLLEFELDFREPKTESISVEAAVAWAERSTCLTRNDALSSLKQSTSLSSDNDGTLTYCSFVLYAARCFVQVCRNSKSANSDIVNDGLSALVTTIHTRVASLSAVTTLSPEIILKFVNKNTVWSPAVLDSIAHATLVVFESMFLRMCTENLNGLKMSSLLPPRPPATLWDAPRYTYYCKVFGLTNFVGSLCTIWRVFGAQLNHREDEEIECLKAFAVDPNPLLSNTSTLIALLSRIEDGEKLVNSTIFPLLASHADQALEHHEHQKDYHSELLILEDLLRYGGDRAVAALRMSTNWLHGAYSSLARDKSEGPEPALPAVCHFLSCGGLLRPGAIAVLAKKALHPRQRPMFSATSSNGYRGAPSLSFVEFEELFLNCAAASWSSSGAAFGAACFDGSRADRSDQTFEDPEESSLLSMAYYCERCNSDRQQGLILGSWGVDYVTPYLMTLQRTVLMSSIDTCALSQSDNDCASTLGSFPSKLESCPSGSLVHPLEQCELTEATPRASQADQVQEVARVITLPDTSDKTLISSQGESPDLTMDSYDVEHSIHGSKSKGVQAQNATVDDHSQFICASGPDALLVGTKEALWPVYATYCSCGDSVAPGQLSGPNLFTLLSKLNVLTDRTLLSDIGILLHQISAHTNSQMNSVAIAATSVPDPYESPSLSFEEFLVFLCAFAQLRFEGSVSAPMFATQHFARCDGHQISEDVSGITRDALPSNLRVEIAPELDSGSWFDTWRKFMVSSASFRKLLEECVLPILSRYALLAFPEDARHRDKYASVFSLEVLLAVEASEAKLRRVFHIERSWFNEGSVGSVTQRGKESYSISSETANIVACLQRINLVPQVLCEEEVMQLVRDVLPEDHKLSKGQISAHSRTKVEETSGLKRTEEKDEGKMMFPQWEWVLCVVAFQTVEAAVRQSSQPTDTKKIPKMVAEVISAMSNSFMHA